MFWGSGFHGIVPRRREEVIEEETIWDENRPAPIAVGMPSVPTAPGPVAMASPPQKVRRTLGVNASIGEKDNYRNQRHCENKVLPAATVRGSCWLNNLARDHYNSFKETFQFGRPNFCMAPDGEVRVATCCTGSGAEVFSLLAVVDTLRTTYPDLRFNYAFHCEKQGQKRKFLNKLHQVLHTKLQATCAPCCFDDITKITKGTAQCCVHLVPGGKDGKKQVPNTCKPQSFHWLFCSSSCKDLSKENSGRIKTNIFKDKDQKTPGGSAETFWALTDITDEYRPDIVFFENVTDIATCKDDDESNMTLLKKHWAERGYQCQVLYTDTCEYGLPQHRKRVVIVAINIRDPELITFEHRPIDRVFSTLRQLSRLCSRRAVSASEYLLPWDDPHVTAELHKLQAESEQRVDKGYNHQDAMEMAESLHIEWGSFPASRWPSLQTSRWFHTLTKRQQAALCFNCAQHDGETVFFRNIAPSFGQGRVAHKGADGRVIAGTIVPNQLVFIFYDNLEPRILLGRESLALQGFPIDVLDKMGTSPNKDYLKEALLGDLAGNMVSTPVMLATVMATMAAVSWITAPGLVATTVEHEFHGEIEPQSPPKVLVDSPGAMEVEVRVDSSGAMEVEVTRRKPGGICQRVLSAPVREHTSIYITAPGLVFETLLGARLRLGLVLSSRLFSTGPALVANCFSVVQCS